MTILDEQEVKIFIDAVTHYFSHLTSESAQIRAAYLADKAMPLYDYTGLISLSGQFRGNIYFSAPRRLLRELLVQLHEPDTCENNLLDAVGEVANTISGNARRHFGQALEISVPTTLHGSDATLRPAASGHPLAIMLSWKNLESVVVVDLEQAAAS